LYTSPIGLGSHGFFGTLSYGTVPTFYPITDVDAGSYIIPVPACNYAGGDSISFPQGGVYVIQFLIVSEYSPTPYEVGIVGHGELYDVSILFESKNLNYALNGSFTEVVIVHCSDYSSFVLPTPSALNSVYGAGAWENMYCENIVVVRLS